MKRRNFIRGLAATAAWPVAGRAQQPERVRRIGVLQPGARDDPENRLRLTTFQQALQGLGWTEVATCTSKPAFPPQAMPPTRVKTQRNWLRLRLTSFLVLAARVCLRCSRQPGLCRSFLYSSPIRWAPASSIACRSQAVTPLAL